jgi:hypothetical protein
MHDYDIKPFGDKGDVMLTRRKYYDVPIQGLPPCSSTTLVLKDNEIDELIEVIKNYANERGNKKVQSTD